MAVFDKVCTLLNWPLTDGTRIMSCATTPLHTCMPGHAVARVAGVAKSVERSPTPFRVVAKAATHGMHDVPWAGTYPWRERAFYSSRLAVFPPDGSISAPRCYEAGERLLWLEDVRGDAEFPDVARQLHGRYGEECILAECLGGCPLFDEVDSSRPSWHAALWAPPDVEDFRQLSTSTTELALSLLWLAPLLSVLGASAMVVAGGVA